MKITRVAWQGFAIPFRRMYLASNAEAATRYGLILFLYSDNGMTGVGEASPIGAGGRRDIEETAALLERFAPRLLGMDIAGSAALQQTSKWNIPPFLRFGVETALLDLAGRATGRSVMELLGGTPRPLPANFLITSDAPQEAAAQAREAVTAGFNTLKLKVGRGTIQEDEALLSAMRDAVGPVTKLRLDPNGAWTISQAIQAIRRLAAYELEYVEQPVQAGDVLGLGEVRRSVDVPIAADEALGSMEDLRRLLAADASDLFIIKAGRLGGLDTAVEVIRAAAEFGKPSVVTSSLESGVGLAASTHLAAMLTSHPFAHGLATGLLLESDLLTTPLLPHSGILPVPMGPGLGVEVDGAALDKYSIGIKRRVGS